MKDKRTMVLKELKPLAKRLGIKLDYVIEENREYLLCDSQAICCNCTSIVGIYKSFSDMYFCVSGVNVV